MPRRITAEVPATGRFAPRTSTAFIPVAVALRPPALPFRTAAARRGRSSSRTVLRRRRRDVSSSASYSRTARPRCRSDAPWIRQPARRCAPARDGGRAWTHGPLRRGSISSQKPRVAESSWRRPCMPRPSSVLLRPPSDWKRRRKYRTTRDEECDVMALTRLEKQCPIKLRPTATATCRKGETVPYQLGAGHQRVVHSPIQDRQRPTIVSKGKGCQSVAT
jgi:hypothetical protein